jgi:hypothetical protein
MQFRNVTLLALAIFVGLAGCKKALRLEPDEIEKEIVEFRKHSATLFLDRNFGELERISAEARRTRARFGNGGWKLYQFHDAITYQEGFHETRVFTTEEWKLNREINELWVRKYPGSITARISLMKYWIYSAWEARGDGRAIKKGGEKDWIEGLVMAKKELDEGLKYQETSTMLWCAGMDIAAGQRWPWEQTLAFWEQGKKNEPEFQMLDFEMAGYLGIQWDVPTGEFEKFAEQEISRSDGLKEEGYARVAENVRLRYKNIFRETDMKWPIIKKGYEQMLKKYPHSRQLQSQFALLAGEALDRETSRKAFAELHGVGSPIVWCNSLEYFSEFRDWLDQP